MLLLLCISLLFCTSLTAPTNNVPDHVRVVAIFGRTSSSRFNIAAAKLFAYNDKTLLFNRTRFVVDIVRLPDTDNMLEISGFLCAELQSASNLVGFLLGDISQPVWSYLKELAQGWQIPVVDIFRDPALKPSTGISKRKKKFPARVSRKYTDPLMLLTMHPSYLNVASAIHDVAIAYKWKRLVLLYDTINNLVRMQSLIGASPKSTTVREYVVLQVSDDTLYDIVKVTLNVQRWSTVVVAFQSKMTIKFLKTALRCGMLTSKYAYILANANIHLYSMEEFTQNWPNVTLIRPVLDNTATEHWMEAARNFEKVQVHYKVLINSDILGVSDAITLPPQLDIDQQLPIHLTSALVLDGLYVFRRAVEKTLLTFFDWIKVNPAEMLSCTRTYPLLNGYGSFIHSQLINDTAVGLSGQIKFNEITGNRENVRFDVMALSSKGMLKIGDWLQSYGGDHSEHKGRFQTDRNSAFLWRPLTVDDDLYVKLKIKPGDINTMRKVLTATYIKSRTLTVTTVLEKPYAMIKKKASDHRIAPSSRAVNIHNLEGFCVDLIEEVARIIGFSYKLKVVDDGNYGKFVNSTGKWNGMIGEVIDGVADIAAAPLTVTYAREQVVDFTKPFLNLGISILYVQPSAAPPSLFSFMDPLGRNVWIAISMSSILATLVIFIVGRLSPYEFDYNSEEIDSDTEHPYSCSDSTWYIVGGFLGLGSEISPEAMSARTVTAAWWFFSLIMISSYTANLAAFLTIETQISPFENVEEMARQSDVLYGTLKGGSTENFFKEGKIDTYRRMWSFMKDKDVFARSNTEGIRRVRDTNGKYAYLMESVSLEYVLKDNQQNTVCNLRQVGGLIDSKGYGFATKRGSSFRDLLSMAILQLQETDRLQIIYSKWWKSEHSACSTEKGSQGAKVMLVNNVLGIFFVLGLGFAFSLIVVCVEVLWNTRRKIPKETPNYCRRLLRYIGTTCGSWRKSERPIEIHTRRSSHRSLDLTAPALESIREVSEEESPEPFDSSNSDEIKSIFEDPNISSIDLCSFTNAHSATEESEPSSEGSFYGNKTTFLGGRDNETNVGDVRERRVNEQRPTISDSALTNRNNKRHSLR